MFMLAAKGPSPRPSVRTHGYTPAVVPRVLVVAYACEPGAGSEPGAGWAVVLGLAAHANVTVVVGSHHHDGIAAFEAKGGHPGIHFVEVALPPWSPPWRPPLARFLTYLGWLPLAEATARRLLAESTFDVVWHVTYAAYWLPTPAGRLGRPFVVGPVGGAVSTPQPLLRTLGIRGLATELVERIVVRSMERLPLVRRSYRGAAAVLSQNAETTARLRTFVAAPVIERNHVELLVPVRREAMRRRGEVLWLSPLEARKGPRLAVHALRHAPTVRLTMVGAGPERHAVKRLARRLRVADRLTLLGRIPHAEVYQRMAEAGCIVFTGLHEEGGISLAEALTGGAPVVLLAVGGPRDIAGRLILPEQVVAVPPGEVAVTARRLGEAMQRLASAPPPTTAPLIDRDAAVRVLGETLALALRTPQAGAQPRG